MTRSPLAYPLNRGADMDVGGAADLQTDVMRFMAILSLCLVAIFALVQSMPMAPPADPVVSVDPEPAQEQVVESPPITAPEPISEPVARTINEASDETVILTRPKWKTKYPAQARPAPDPAPVSEAVAVPVKESAAVPVTETAAEPVVAPVEEPEGFTLRFESDAALMRLVAASQVGVYAIENERARRMKVSESRISFWDASIPNSFHEMEVSTVPLPVVDALARAGADTDSTDWGVTLPGKLKGQLDGLMQDHRGGSLVIGSNGNIRLEAL